MPRPASLSVRFLTATTFGLAALLPCEAGAVEADPWTQLDDQLAEMASQIPAEDAGLEVSAYIKSSYRRSNEIVYTFDPNTFAPLGDYGGFAIDSIGLSVKGKVEEFSFKFGYNPNADKLRSTYVRWHVTDAARVTMGKFKVPLLRSRLVRTTRLLFLDRSVQARATGPRELGLKCEYDFGEVARLYIAIQDGQDGTLDKRRTTMRLNANLLDGGVSKYEGAFNAKSRWRSSLGIGYSDDSSLGDGRILAADFGLTKSRFSLSAEWLNNGDDLGKYKRGILDPATFLQRGGTQPLSVAVSWMLVDDKLEAGARWQNFDDPNHTEMLTLGLNHYFKGHHAKVQLNWIDVTSDIAGLESNVIALGLVLDA